MMALVFRFSDFQADTYREHARVMSVSGHVWWGWWKKQHEAFPTDVLQALSSELAVHPVDIGLVNRSGVYLIARCDAIQFAGGDPIPSPDVDRTPDYYGRGLFPLWMRLINFREVSQLDWVRIFGPIPVGDETFFADDAGSVEVVHQPNDEASGKGVLHISDLHFGDDFAFRGDGQIFHRKPLEVRIADALAEKPAGVVVSGDLTTQGSNDGLVSARKFLERLAEELDVTRDRFVIVPVNHDILVNDPEVTQDFENEQHFRTQLFEFYGYRPDLERIQQFRGADGISYVIATLNSSRPRDRATMDYGYVGRDRSEPILSRAADIRDSLDGPTWLGLVLHHHILPGQQIEYAVPGRPVSLAIDAGELVGMAADLRYDAILHGHEHLPFVGKTSRIAEFGGYNRKHIGVDHPVLVLAAGSASAKVSRLTDEMRFNSFSHYEVGEDSLNVRLFQYTEKVDPHVTPGWAFNVPRV